MIVIAGGDLILPDRILTSASLVIDKTRIAAIERTARRDVPGATVLNVPDCYVVPGFVDVHVHGVDGFDTLDAHDPIAEMASRLPRYGVTAFCPTTVACPPSELRAALVNVARSRAVRPPGSARVLPAHLESNFINPQYRGAQPLECLRAPAGGGAEGDFTGREILDVVAAHRADVGLVTLAPELPGGLDLVRQLVTAGHRVSIGHTAATFEEANAAIDAGVRHATHLFNRMTPLGHREPGAAGAALARDEVMAELICDGFHVHPALCRVAIASKGTAGTIAITDGTAGSGLAPGSTARLGGRAIEVRERAAFLADGTLAGSTLTMDRAFRAIVAMFGLTIVDAALLCATTPARALGLTGCGAITEGAAADVTVLDRGFRVVRTFVGGAEAWREP